MEKNKLPDSPKSNAVFNEVNLKVLRIISPILFLLWCSLSSTLPMGKTRLRGHQFENESLYLQLQVLIYKRKHGHVLIRFTDRALEKS